MSPFPLPTLELVEELCGSVGGVTELHCVVGSPSGHWALVCPSRQQTGCEDGELHGFEVDAIRERLMSGGYCSTGRLGCGCRCEVRRYTAVSV